MALLIASLLAGVFSALAPCVLPLLPVMIAPSAQRGRRHLGWLLAGLAGSVIAFSILLKSTTLLLGVPSAVWSAISGGIILLFGVTLLAPKLWERLMVLTGLAVAAQKQSSRAAQRRGRLGDVLFGASLGPIFSVCSPTYALIVAVLLPAKPLVGALYLLAYVAGLIAVLALVAVVGRGAIKRLGWGVRPGSAFRRVMGGLLIVLGMMVLTGLDKSLSAWLIQQGWFDWQVQLENWLMG